MAKDVKIRENVSADLALEVSDHERDLSDRAVFVYAFTTSTSRPGTIIGQTTGTADGTPFLIDIDTSLLVPDSYELEIVDETDTMVFPEEPRDRIILDLVNSKFND